MNQSGVGTRILLRLGFGAVGLIIFLISRSGIFQGECNDTVVDNYVKSVDSITDKTDELIDAAGPDNEAATLSAYANLVDEASKLEHPACLDAAHKEVMLAMQSRQEAFEYAYDGDMTRADQAFEEASDHIDKANEAMPNP